LEPSEEEGMLKRLEHKKVPIERIHVRQSKQQSIKSQLQNMCFKDPELKYLGQKAFISYVRSIHIQKDKEVFKLNDLPLEEFSASLGLPGAPRIKFMKGDNAKTLKNAPRHALSSSDDEVESRSEGERPKGKKAATRTKYDRMFERTNQDIFADHYTKLVANDGDKEKADADEGNDFLTVKRRLEGSRSEADDNDMNGVLNPSKTVRVVAGLGKDPLVVDSKRREKLLKSKKKLLKLKERGTKFVFDEQGQARQIYELEDENQFKQRGTAHMQKLEFLNAEEKKLRAADVIDKQTAKGKRKEKKEKRKAREAAETEEGEGVQAILVPYVEPDDGGGAQTRGAEDASPNIQRPKKWFEDDSSDEKKPKRRAFTKPSQAEPDTLEDLEAVAASLLNESQH
jgi:ATP-dependent RNA helicase DDX10/DBP4